MAYERLEPFGEVRADIRNALVCATLVNVNRAGKGSPVARVQDFLLDFLGPYAEKPPIDEQARAATAMVSTAVGKGMIRFYEGEAPPIRKLGKRGRGKKKRRIVGGKPW